MQNVIYWFTGQPGSGKTTLALALKTAIQLRGYPVVHFDGDELRVLTDNQDYSQSGRKKNIITAQNLAAKLQAEKIMVVASFVSPIASFEKTSRKIKPSSKFMSIPVSLQACHGAVRCKAILFAE